MDKEYIERQKIFDALPVVNEDRQISLYGAVADFMIIVSSIPAADVSKVKHGYWEEYWDDDYMESFHRCSECKNDAPAKRDTYCDQVLTNYCPNCGVKMSRN